MTREDLLELGIYVPEKVDSSIVTNLLMGNIVICCLKNNIVHKIYPVALTMAPLYEKSHIEDRFCIFKNLESSKIICTDGPEFVSVWIDNMFSNYIIAPHEIKTILNHFDYD